MHICMRVWCAYVYTWEKGSEREREKKEVNSQKVYVYLIAAVPIERDLAMAFCRVN